MNRTRTTLTLVAAGALALTPAAIAVAADDAPTPAPKLLQAELVTAPEIAPGTTAVVFRTDRKLARGTNGGTLKGRAGITGKANASLGSVRGRRGHACYVAYLTGKGMKVGHRYSAVITIGATNHHRTLTLREPKHVADLGADLNC
jgi:hypothetical protein